MKVKTYQDPLILAIDIAQDRIKALILWEMEKKKQQVTTIFANISGVSNETIMQELSMLMDLGLVARIIHDKKKPHYIEYALTNRGAQLLKCLRKMMNVGIEIMMDYGREDFLEKEGYIVKVEVEEVDEVIEDKMKDYEEDCWIEA